MFFHSRREQETAEIFGVTDPFGVTLLNRDHPFPLLVEEEEKLHGALLANTTHGALYRALGSMLPRQQAGIMNQLYGMVLPKADGFGLDPVNVYNRICFAKDRVLGKALPVHEAFAKYCAVTLQYTALSGASTKTLDELWDDECRRYNWLPHLSDAIG